METKSQNKTTARKAIKSAKNWLKRKYHKPVIEQNNNAHYDLQVGKLCVEVKGSNRESGDIPYIWLNEKEYEFANKNPNNWLLLVVNIKTGKILHYSQKDICSNNKKYIHYAINFRKKPKS